MKHVPVLVHLELYDDLSAVGNPSVSKKLSFALRRLAVYGRTPTVKGTQGLNSEWKRSPLGGNGPSHYYLWWRRERDRQNRPVILAAAVRHHDDHSRLSGREIAGAEEVFVKTHEPDLLPPWSDDQQQFLEESDAVTMVSGYPGSGKTTALWEKVRQEDKPKTLYVTWSPDLAEEARKWFGTNKNPAFHPVTGTVVCKSLRVLLGELVGRDIPAKPQRYLRQQFRDDIRKSHTAGINQLTDQAINEAYDALRGAVFGSTSLILRNHKFQLDASVTLSPTVNAVPIGKLFKALSLESEEKASRYFPDLVALQRAYGERRQSKVEGYDLIAVDEIQDLTELETSLLLELAKDSSSPTRWIFAGDEGQTVRPSGFSWNRLGDQVFRQTGCRRERKQLTSGLRCPAAVTDAVIRFSEDFYHKLEKDVRPRLQRRPDEVSDTNAGVLLCPVDTAKANALVRRVGAMRTVRVLCATDSAPAWLDPELQQQILYPADAKGLEYPSVVLIGLGDAYVALRQATQSVPAPGFVRTMVDQVRVALSRVSGHLFVLESDDEVPVTLEPPCWALSEFLDMSTIDLLALTTELAALDGTDERQADEVLADLRDEGLRLALERPELAARVLRLIADQALEPEGTPEPGGDAVRSRRKEVRDVQVDAYCSVAFRLLLARRSSSVSAGGLAEICDKLTSFLTPEGVGLGRLSESMGTNGLGGLAHHPLQVGTLADERGTEERATGRLTSNPSVWIQELCLYKEPARWDAEQWLSWLRAFPSWIREAGWLTVGIEPYLQSLRSYLDYPERLPSGAAKVIAGCGREQLERLHGFAGRSEADAIEKSVQTVGALLVWLKRSWQEQPSTAQSVARDLVGILREYDGPMRTDAAELFEAMGCYEEVWPLLRFRPGLLAAFALRIGQTERGLKELSSKDEDAREARLLLVEVREVERAASRLMTSYRLPVEQMTGLAVTVWGSSRHASNAFAEQQHQLDVAVRTWREAVDLTLNERERLLELLRAGDARWREINEQVRRLVDDVEEQAQQYGEAIARAEAQRATDHLAERERAVATREREVAATVQDQEHALDTRRQQLDEIEVELLERQQSADSREAKLVLRENACGALVIACEQKEAQLATRETEIVEGHRKFSSARDAITVRAIALTAREADCARREADCARREEQLALRELLVEQEAARRAAAGVSVHQQPRSTQTEKGPAGRDKKPAAFVDYATLAGLRAGQSGTAAPSQATAGESEGGAVRPADVQHATLWARGAPDQDLVAPAPAPARPNAAVSQPIEAVGMSLQTLSATHAIKKVDLLPLAQVALGRIPAWNDLLKTKEARALEHAIQRYRSGVIAPVAPSDATGSPAPTPVGTAPISDPTPSLWKLSSHYQLKKAVVMEVARSALPAVPEWDAMLTPKQKGAVEKAILRYRAGEP